MFLSWITARVSDSVFPTRDYFEKTPNEIPCVNIFPLFLPTLNFELQARNHQYAQNSQQDNLITFILTCNSNTSLSLYTSSMPNNPGPFIVYVTQLKWLREKYFQEEYTANKATIIHQIQSNMFRCSGSSIYKKIISPVQQPHLVLKYFYK